MARKKPRRSGAEYIVERFVTGASRLKIDNDAYQNDALATSTATTTMSFITDTVASFRLYGAFFKGGATLTDPQIAQLVTYYGAKQGRVL